MLIAVKFVGAQEQFVEEALIDRNRSKAAREALLAFCERLTGETAPPSPGRGNASGSRLPEARSLGLSTIEYRRRVRALTKVGVEPTPEAIAACPPAKRRSIG